MLAFLDPKVIVQPSVWWIAGGIITGSGIVVGVVAKIVTRNFITWKEGKKEFRSKEVCDVTVGNMEEKIDNLHDDVKDIGKDIKEILRGK